MAKPNAKTKGALGLETEETPEVEPKGKISHEPAEDDGHVEIDVGDEDEADDGDDEEEGEPARERAAVRRRNKFKEAQERARQAEQRAEEETAARRRAEEEAHRARLAAQGGQQPVSVHQQIEAEHRRIYAAKKELHRAMTAEAAAAGQNGLPQERIDFYDDQARRLNWAEQRLAAYAHDVENAPRQQAALREHYVRSTYPDIVAKPEAVRYGLAVFDMLVAEGWDPSSNATVDEAAKRVRDNPKFGLKKPPPADAATKARLGGAPKGPSNNAVSAGSSKIRLNREEQRIALELYQDMSKEEAFRKHAKKLAERARKKASAEAD